MSSRGELRIMSRRGLLPLATFLLLAMGACDGATRIERSSAAGACVPLTIAPCYDGPAHTEGVGTCVAGTATCNELGTGRGSCIGQVLPGPEECGTGIDSDCSGSTSPCSPWSRSFGGPNWESVGEIAVDSSGHPVAIGTFDGAINLGGVTLSAAEWGAWILELDRDGDHVWSRGSEAWSCEGSRVACDGLGNCSAAFSCSYGYPYGPYGQLLDLAPSGAPRWQFENNDLYQITGLMADAAGNVVLAGTAHAPVDGLSRFVFKLDGAGHEMWTQFVEGGRGPDAALDVMGNVLLARGTVHIAGPGPYTTADQSGFLDKLDAAGTPLWTRKLSESGGNIVSAVATDGAGNVIVAGQFSDTVDFGGGPLTGSDRGFVAKLDADGNHLWSRALGGSPRMSYGDLAVDASDHIVLTGSFEGVLDCGGGALTSAGGTDAFVAKLDPLGNHVWSARFGDADDQEGKGVAVDASGSIFVTGEFYGAIDFGTGVHVSAGASDIFVARLAP